MALLSKLQRIPAQWCKTTQQMEISSTLFVILTTFSGSSLLTSYGTRGVTRIIRAKGRRRSRCDRKFDPGLYRSGGIGSASGINPSDRIRPRINFTSGFDPLPRKSRLCCRHFIKSCQDGTEPGGGHCSPPPIIQQGGPGPLNNQASC